MRLLRRLDRPEGREWSVAPDGQATSQIVHEGIGALRRARANQPARLQLGFRVNRRKGVAVAIALRVFDRRILLLHADVATDFIDLHFFDGQVAHGLILVKSTGFTYIGQQPTITATKIATMTPTNSSKPFT